MLAAKEVLQADPAIAAAYVFGSFETERFSDGSDIDIGVLYSVNPADLFEPGYFTLKAKLEDSLRREVDLVVLNAASPLLCMQVLKHGRKIFVRNSRAADDFFVNTVVSYMSFSPLKGPSLRPSRLVTPHLWFLAKPRSSQGEPLVNISLRSWRLCERNNPFSEALRRLISGILHLVSVFFKLIHDHVVHR